MKEYSVAALAQIIKAKAAENTKGVFTSVSTDSRTIKAGECFFAISGNNFDGHDYVPDVFAKGAACAVVSKDIKNDRVADKPILKVNDTIEALGMFAAEYRRQNNFKVVAITGSAGKTTTKQIVYHVLSSHFRTFVSPKSFNNNIGVPLTLLGAAEEDEIVVAEIGTNHPGEIAHLARIAQPDIAVVTNIGPAHLEGFGNLEAITEEKLSISEGLRSNGTFIINGDCNQLVDACRAKGVRFITFGKSRTCDIQVKNITYDYMGSEFTIENKCVAVPLPGPGNVENALAAWSICRQFGITIADFARAVKSLAAVSMRTELVQTGSLTILNDCYNANPASMKNALAILANLGLAQKRRLVFICGDMAELGQYSEQFHAELGASIAQAEVQLLLAVGKFAKITAEAAKKNVKYNLQTECFEDTLSVCNNLKKFIKNYDIILVKGSRITRLEATIEKLKELFP